MSYKLTQVVTPGTNYTLPLTQGLSASAVEVWNGTPFDLDYSGFGASSQEIVVAGTGKRFYANINNTGRVNILAVNNNNVSGTGIVNILVYNLGDPIDMSMKFPATIPVQVVQATTISVPFLDNEGNAAGTQIIKSVVSGDGTNQAVSLTNDAVFVLGDAAHPGSLTLFGHLITNNNVTHQWKDAGGTARDTLYVDANNDFNIQQAAAAKSILFKNNAASQLAAIDGSGHFVMNNNVTFQFKDSTGAAIDSFYLDAANNLNLQGRAATELVNIKKSDGTTKFVFDTLNAILTLIGPIKPNLAGTTINGATAGSITMYEVWTGKIKFIVFVPTTTLNQGTTDINFALTAAFTDGCIAITSNPWSLVEFVSGGVVQSIVHGIAGSGAVTASSMSFEDISAIRGAFDTVRFTGSGGASPTGGPHILIGV